MIANPTFILVSNTLRRKPLGVHTKSFDREDELIVRIRDHALDGC